MHVFNRCRTPTIHGVWFAFNAYNTSLVGHDTNTFTFQQREVLVKPIGTCYNITVVVKLSNFTYFHGGCCFGFFGFFISIGIFGNRFSGFNKIV